jgi:hypothetical protein
VVEAGHGLDRSWHRWLGGEVVRALIVAGEYEQAERLARVDPDRSLLAELAVALAARQPFYAHALAQETLGQADDGLHREQAAVSDETIQAFAAAGDHERAARLLESLQEPVSAETLAAFARGSVAGGNIGAAVDLARTFSARTHHADPGRFQAMTDIAQALAEAGWLGPAARLLSVPLADADWRTPLPVVGRYWPHVVVDNLDIIAAAASYDHVARAQ